MSRKKIFLCVMAASVFINAVIFIIMILCGFTPGFTVYSFYIAVLAFFYFIMGIVIYFDRHPETSIISRISEMKVNGNGPEIPHTVTEFSTGIVRKPDSYSEKNMRYFTFAFCVYWFAAPFFINIMLFAKSDWAALPLLLLLLLPCIMMLIFVVFGLRRDAKEINEINSRVAKELEEQKKREEMGHFK